MDNHHVACRYRSTPDIETMKYVFRIAVVVLIAWAVVFVVLWKIEKDFGVQETDGIGGLR